MNLNRRLFTAAAVASTLALGSSAALAQAYPAKPISLVVPFAAGGPTDIVARTLAATMTKSLGQSVVVENKTGAGGTIAAGFVMKAPADGYTFLIHHNGMATAPALYRKLAYNPVTDFEHVGNVVDVPMTMLGRKDMPAATMADLVNYVKANADKINLANAGLGAVSHLCGTLFQQALGVNVTTIPFQGTGPALNALLGGQVDLLCDQTTNTVPHIKAGTVKLYGVTTKQRIKALPDAPTMSEGGVKDFEVIVWHGVYAPKGTPAPVIQKVGDALREALKDPAFIQRMAELGGEIPPAARQTSDGQRAWLVSEVDKWGKAIRAAGQFAD
ncbi:MAG: tripartite tricarboxylate transporter substrate-binding protein [Hylemonella sp.]|uniref:tripartite tricarboxylate transporter substrate-binding protein n=1 Tax=Hylemonella sp. TaxID=2066020 RepID=UPI0022C0F5E6|nr:tripartite tricarboxylate transporter substrate-binding protein [Hylemonella sp.]MCZ8253018.1 tripartite tricarboxylate transporter substrate-binding protein [Hylemonella sp.]